MRARDSIFVVTHPTADAQVLQDAIANFSTFEIHYIRAPDPADDNGQIDWIKPLARRNVFVALPPIYFGLWRKSVAVRLRAMRCNLLNLISPTAVIEATAKIGSGVYVGPASYVGLNAEIGNCTFIGTKTYLATESKVAAYCSVGDCSFIDVSVRIGAHCVIGNQITIRRGLTIHEFCELSKVGETIVEDLNKETHVLANYPNKIVTF